MSRFTKFLILVVLLFVIDATFTTLSANKSTPTKFSVLHYINQYKNIAINEMQRTRIPASITLAQGILESAYGNSYLARSANNHFGIKCHSSWSGKTVYANDDEDLECFRKYTTGGTSYRDHSNFLANNSRYSFLFRYKPSDYRSWATGLGKAGYATNTQYGSHLIRIIERYQLHTFDRSKEQLQQEKLDRIMRDYQLLLKGMMNEEDLYPTWFINDRPSQPSLLSSIKRRTPMMTTTYGWSSTTDTESTVAKAEEKSSPKIIASAKLPSIAKPEPKTVAPKKVVKTVVVASNKKTATKTTIAEVKKTIPKPVVKKEAEPSKNTIAATKPTPKKKEEVKPKVVSKPEKSVAVAEVTPKPSKKTVKTEAKADLFTALNSWKKKNSTTNEKAITTKETPKPNASSKITHTVKEGETLYGLARKYNTKVEQIKKSNGLADTNIKPGTRLVIEP
ncbi:MAG: glucosaminidase domain-containing protein [Chitinophagales bacterium]